jgi:hypothetical protein
LGQETAPLASEVSVAVGEKEEGRVEPEAAGMLALMRLKTSLMSWEERSRPPLPEPLPLPPLPLPLRAGVRGAGSAARRFLEPFGAEPPPRGKRSGPGSKPMAASLAG